MHLSSSPGVERQRKPIPLSFVQKESLQIKTHKKQFCSRYKRASEKTVLKVKNT